MFHKIVSSLVAFSIVGTPVGSAYADTYMFRYKAPMMASAVTPPIDDTEYGVGNDIVAYYVAPIGYDFLKKIPVATKDVVKWRKDSGAEPTGVSLDVVAGVFSGEPTVEGLGQALYYGYDANGNRIARAEVHFTVFQPVGIPSVVDFYTHTNTYFYGEIPNPEGVTVHNWVPVQGLIQNDDMEMTNSAFQGTPTKAGTWGLAWRGYDYLGREVAFAYGDFLVADGPVVEELLAAGAVRDVVGSQIADKTRGESFDVTATVRRALGPVTYKLVPEKTRPSGISFASSAGKIGGVFDDFDTSASFRIEARDSYDGTTGLSNVFTLETLAADADLSAVSNLYGVVGTRYSKKLSASDVAPGASWSVVQRVLPRGVVLDSTTGLISGTPTTTEVQTGIVFGVSGPGTIPAQSNPVEFRVYSEDISAKSEMVKVRTGTQFATDGVTIEKGGSEGVIVSSTKPLDGDLTLDQSTGVMTSAAGFAKAGYYDHFLRVENANRTKIAHLWQNIRVFNPLNVRYENYEIVRHQWLSKYPAIEDMSVIGTPSYSIVDVNGAPLPEWMSFNNLSGRITGTPHDISTADKTFGPYVVTIRDDQASAPSEPFTITVKDRAAVEVTINDQDVQRYVSNGYPLATAKNTYSSTKFSLTSIPSNWPSTLRLTDGGWLFGTTDDPIGTVYSGLVVTATDGEGYSSSSATFDLTVIEPSALGPLYGSLNKTIEWTEGQSLSDRLPELGNAYGSVLYSFDTSGFGVSIADATTGKISGTVSAAGDYAVGYKIDDDTDRVPAAGILTLKINATPVASAEQEYTLHRAADFEEVIPMVVGGTKPFSYNIVGALPKGVSFSSGRLVGKPGVEGVFPVAVTATDKAGASATASFNLNVGPPLDFKVSYASEPLTLGQPISLAPKVENALDGNVVWGAMTGHLPPGMSFNQRTGYIAGIPQETGRWTGSVVATDGEGRVTVASFVIVVSPAGEPDFTDVTIKHRKGASFTDSLIASNVVAPVIYSSIDPSGLPFGLVLNGTKGTITGSFADEGTYPVGIFLADDHGRSASATLTYEIVGDLAIAAFDLELSQYLPAEGASVVVPTNNVGNVSYSLLRGTLPVGLSVDPSTGAIVGTPDEFGKFDGIVILGTDADGATDESNAISVTVSQREQLVLTAPSVLFLKRFGVSDFVSSVESEIPPVRYDVTPNLPTGLALDEATGAISGSSDELVSSTVYTLRAVDSKGGQLGSDLAQFTLSVEEREALTLTGPGEVEFSRHREGGAIYSAENGVGAVAFSITPALPEGLTLDPSSGAISGTAHAVAAPTAYVLSAKDSKGGSLGSATKTLTLSVKEREALGIDGPDAHEFAQYSEGAVSYSPTNAIGDVSFSIAPPLPLGLTLDRSTGVISGAISEKMEPASYILTVSDAYDTVPKSITLSVGDRLPLAITTAAAQSIILGKNGYTLTLSADNVVGDVAAWTHVSGDLPEGITFDASTGTFSGAATEFNVSTVTIRATDAVGGSDERSFVFTIIQDGTPIGLSTSGVTTRVGQALRTAAPVPANTVGDFWYVAAGLEGTGLSVDRRTGVVSGVGAFVYDKDVTITVEDVTGRQQSAVATIKVVPSITVTVPGTLALTYNRGLPSEMNPVATETVGAVVWSYQGRLPTGVDFDTTTGVFTGKPMETGTFGPIILTAADALPGVGSSTPISISVEMNDDPIGLTVADFMTKVGRAVATSVPSYDNELGPVTFFSTELGGTGMSINPDTGVLTGVATALMDRFINISIRDRDTTRVTSKPLRLQIIPNMQITLPAQLVISALSDIEPIAPTRNYVIGAATWESLDQSVNKLPDGIHFDEASGKFVGNATEIGTFGPFTVASTDAVGDRGVSNSFVIKSNPGAYFLGLAGTSLPVATKRVESYAFDFKNVLTNVGMDESEIAWSLGAGAPPGLSIANGLLSGIPSLSGKYDFEVIASYENIKATRKYQLDVELPETVLTLDTADLGEAKRRRQNVDNSFTFDLKSLTRPIKNIPLESVVYALVPPENGESFPVGLTVGPDGVISGVADDAEGTYAFQVRASFKDSADEDVSAYAAFTLKVVDEVKFEFGTAEFAKAYKRLAYSFDLGSLLDPAKTGGVTAADLSWSWTIDPSIQGNMTALPAGLRINANTLSGTPLNSGSYAVVVTASYDGRVRSKALVLQSGLQEISLALSATGPAAGEKDVAYSADLKALTATKNIRKEELVWSQSTNGLTAGSGEVVGLPSGVVLSPAGVLSGTPTIAGKYKFTTKAVWDDKNSVAEHAEDSKVYTIVIKGVSYHFVQISLGEAHSCGVTPNGGAKCWGANVNGRLGDRTTTDRSTPVDVWGLTSGVKEISAGAYHTCAVLVSGGVKCWGHSGYGQLGNGGTGTQNAVPVDVSGLTSGVVSVSSRYRHTCAILASGAVKCWGSNSNGQLGNNSTTQANSPVDVSGLTSGASGIAVGEAHSCALLTSGTVKCWGAGVSNGTMSMSLTPVEVPLLTGASSISAGAYHTCVTTAGTGAKCWGVNSKGQLGNGTASDSRLPVDVMGLTSGVSKVAAGSVFTCAILNSGAAKCWGQGTSGQLGAGDSRDSSQPTDVTGLTSGVSAIAGGVGHACAETADGAVCWGAGGTGRLGNGSSANSLTPTFVGG